MDPDGRFGETVWDALNAGIDLTSFGNNMASGNYWGAAFDLFSLLYDSFATAMPGLPGGTGTAKLVSSLASEYGDDAIQLVLKYSDDIAEIVFKGGNSKKLGDNIVKALGLSARPAGKAAHHIVAGGSRFAKDTRIILAKFNININDAANGVFLETSKHVGLHTKKYYEKVHDILSKATSREEALNMLKSIAKKLEQGIFE